MVRTSQDLLRESAGSFIAPNNHRQHGAKLTDVNIHHANSSVSHLSLKFGSTLTFMNSGVAGFLSQDEIKSGMIKNKLGLALLETFGIDILSSVESLIITARK